MNHVKPNDFLERAREADALYEFNRREREQDLRHAKIINWTLAITVLAFGLLLYGIFR